MATITRSMHGLGGAWNDTDIQQIEIGMTDNIEQPRPMDVEATYDTNDPFAVKLSFNGFEHMLERSLLFMGRSYPAGEGDARVLPGPGFTFCAFSAGGTMSVVLLPTDELSQFLFETQSAVALGEESVDVESMLEKMLKEMEEM